MPVVVVSILMMLLSVWTYLSADSLRASKEQRLSVLADGQALIASELQRYHLETGTWPASLEALSSQPAYGHLKTYVSAANGGVLPSPTSPWKVVSSNVLTNGTIRYQRAAAIAQKDFSVAFTDYLSSANNTCNAGGTSQDFYNASAWCGGKSAFSTKFESSELRGQRERWAHRQQRATANKLVRRYKAGGSLPAAATATALRTLATATSSSSAVGTDAQSCMGTFTWQGMGLECEDLYNQFGNPVSYRQVSTRSFELTSTSQVLNSAGTPLTITTTVDASTPLLATQVASGGDHTCVLTLSGGVKCWGSNTMGQGGNGTTTSPITVPTDVTGLTSGVAAISAGYNHTCALLTTGGMKCWGNNFYGHLGDGTTTQRTTPVDVSGMTSGVARISAGENFTCAITSAGAARCWGLNASGQLGNGTVVNSSVPVSVTGLTSGVAQISAGGSHACAVTTAGAARCWGLNSSGQLGDTTVVNRSTSVAVWGLGSGVAAVSTQSGAHSCALMTTGGVKCWGNNGSGQIGNNSATATFSSPQDVSGLASGVASVVTGGLHSCAVLSNGSVQCWGLGTSGQLGNGTLVTSRVPVLVSGWGAGTGSATVSLGYTHTCARKTDNKVSCWGRNQASQVGDATTTNRSAPSLVNQ